VDGEVGDAGHLEARTSFKNIAIDTTFQSKPQICDTCIMYITGTQAMANSSCSWFLAAWDERQWMLRCGGCGCAGFEFFCEV
jgi:hypothetical protein